MLIPSSAAVAAAAAVYRSVEKKAHSLSTHSRQYLISIPAGSIDVYIYTYICTRDVVPRGDRFARVRRDSSGGKYKAYAKTRALSRL